MKIFKLISTLFILLIIFTSCEDKVITVPEAIVIEEPVIDDIDISDNFGAEINRNFLGRVIDVNRNPIEGVSIRIGNSAATTDNRGGFIIFNASVFERFAYITATKAGFIQGSRALVPNDGVNIVTIMMLDDTVIDTTESGETKTISLSNGASVTLNGEYVDEDGNPYTGTVDVILHHLDPANDDMNIQMPGMLYAGTRNNEEQMLQSYGMLGVELRGANGEELNIAPGSSAEIRIPIDSSLIPTAPSTIILWYFDETKGYWVEDGIATLIGNEYVGTVTHFSFWNCDANFPTVNLCINVTDENGNPLANQTLTLSFNDYPYPRQGITNELGQVCGLIPSNEALELNAFDYEICGENSIFTSNIGPFSEDSEIAITIPSGIDVISETVTGTFNKCDGNAVTNGYVLLTYGDQIFTNIVSDGSFEINLLRCTDVNAFTIEGIDYDNTQTTGEISYTFTTPTTNLGTINSCNDISEFIQYDIDNGVANILISVDVSAFLMEINPNFNNHPTLNISGNDGANTACFFMESVLADAPYLGTYGFRDFQDGPDVLGFNILECIDMTSNNNNITFNLTNLGEVGEYIDINFAGDYEDFNGGIHTINGVIHVLRD